MLNAAGAVVQSVAVGPRGAGANSATWNGRLTGGAWAPAGSYLLRVIATDSAGADHAGPAASFSQAALGRWGVVADLVAPTAVGSPRRGAEMVPAKTGARVTFSEPISGLSTNTVQLQANGAQCQPQSKPRWMAGAPGHAACRRCRSTRRFGSGSPASCTTRPATR